MERMPDLAEGSAMPADRTRTRWKAIKKEVVYLDFRSELSAYDKYFYHIPIRPRVTSISLRTSGRAIDKKATIRRRTKHLARSMATGRPQHVFYNRQRVTEPARELNEEQRHAISTILGREYVSVKLIRHRYFDVTGATVVLATAELRYSEAFAGSGEFAVAMLVVGVTEAPEGSLILLDEPEVSLHPGAQTKLMEFLANQVKSKRHQVVISTHSPEIIRDLPPAAIKLFLPSTVNGKVELLSQQSEPGDAFFRLGVKPDARKRVYVEDGLAAAVVRKAIRPLGEPAHAQLDIVALPGGTNSIQTRFIPAFALSGTVGSLVLLDGDQRPSAGVPAAGAVSNDDLPQVIRAVLHGDPQLSPSGGSGESAPGAKLDQMRRILEWMAQNVDYLPGGTPEALLLEMGDPANLNVQDAKLEWEHRARRALDRQDWEPVTSAEILGEQERMLALLDPNSAQLRQIRSRIHSLISAGGS